MFTTISILSILALERQHAVAKYILRASTLVPLGLEASFQFLDDLATVLFTVVALAALCCKLVVLHNPDCVCCESECLLRDSCRQEITNLSSRFNQCQINLLPGGGIPCAGSVASCLKSITVRYSARLL